MVFKCHHKESTLNEIIFPNYFFFFFVLNDLSKVTLSIFLLLCLAISSRWFSGNNMNWHFSSGNLYACRVASPLRFFSLRLSLSLRTSALSSWVLCGRLRQHRTMATGFSLSLSLSCLFLYVDIYIRFLYACVCVLWALPGPSVAPAAGSFR